MGFIKTDKREDGTYLLEITYGGKEAPFGGIDTSAPPAYIDPTCLVDANGFLIADNQLIATALRVAAFPQLWSLTPAVQFIGCGTFFNSTYGQLNYALGVKIATTMVAPFFTQYTFYMTAWDPSNLLTVYNDVLEYTLFDSLLLPTFASITLPLIPTGSQASGAGSGANLQITAVTSSGSTIGKVSTYTLSGGSGYTAGHAITVIQGTPGTASGGGGVNNDFATITINTVGGTGNILTSTLSYGGSGYGVAAASALSILPTTLELTISGPSSAASYTVTTSPILSTSPQILTAFVTNINAAPDPNVVASVSPDGFSLVLTASVAGAAGNLITVQDTSTSSTLTLPPSFYFPARFTTALEGGKNAITAGGPRTLGVASIVAVGGALYIGNVGPVLLQYQQPGQFSLLTAYNGAQLLTKFAGSLLALGPIPQLGTLTQNTDMIVSWSSALNFAEWNPVNSQGFVTGAGFAQLDDISDGLTGLIISNNTAWIIRQEGLTYATPTGNGAEPFNFANVSLGSRGEGAQIPALVCQYDMAGMYIGNTNVWSIIQSPTQAGEKIKNEIFEFLGSIPDPAPSLPADPSGYLMSSNACAMSIGGTVEVYYAFQLGRDVYFANATNGTWMKLSFNQGSSLTVFPYISLLCTQSNSSLSTPEQGFSQSVMGFAYGVADTTDIPPLYEGAQISYYTDEILGSLHTTSVAPYLVFPVEEIAFGRSVTIDGFYVSLLATIPPEGYADVTLTFQLYGQVLINGVSQSTLITESATVLTYADFPNAITPSTVPTELQIFPTGGAVSVNSPQLQIQISTGAENPGAALRIIKIAMFGSFDPNQRPV